MAALKDAVQAVGEWVARLYLLGVVPLLADTRTKERSAPTASRWSTDLSFCLQRDIKNLRDVHSPNNFLYISVRVGR